MIYQTKVSSRKHIFCEEVDIDTFKFIVVLLINATDLDERIANGFKLAYKRKKVAIVVKAFVLSKETIGVFCDFAFRFNKQ
jgi:hypothetical protein